LPDVFLEGGLAERLLASLDPALVKVQRLLRCRGGGAALASNCGRAEVSWSPSRAEG
jgi:hypothetical protein